MWPARIGPVYSLLNLETRDVPQWQPEQLVSPRIIKQFSSPSKCITATRQRAVHFCENDLGLADRTSLCEDKLGNTERTDRAP